MTIQIKISSEKVVKALIVCADWCSVCRDYRIVLKNFSEFDIQWIDINDFELLTDKFDIETFPTVVIFNEMDILFVGAVEPSKDSLKKLLSAVATHQPKENFSELRSAIQQRLEN